LPQNRRYVEDDELGFTLPSPSEVKEGQATLPQVLQFLTDHQTDRQLWSSSAIANKYKINHQTTGKYTLSEAWSGVNWADLMAAQGAFGTDFYDRSIRMIVGTRLWGEYRPVIKVGPKGALGSHEIRPIHSAPSLGQSIGVEVSQDGASRSNWGSLMEAHVIIIIIRSLIQQRS